MSKYASLPAAILIICLLSGCAGALLALVFKALAVGALVAEVDDLVSFGKDSTEYTLYFDGHNTGKHPNSDGKLNLEGLPTGHHLLTLADTDMKIGFHKHVLITASGSLNLGSVTMIEGGTISGRLRRQVGGTNVPLAGVRVAAISGGGDLITQSTGRQLTLPPENDTDVVMMGFTDENGYYKLGPASFEQPWIVTAAYPGCLTDVKIVQVSSGSSPDDVNLLLPPDEAAAEPPNVQGTVVKKSGGVLDSALVALDLATPFGPEVSSDREDELASSLGTLRAQPWFAWSSLATETTAAGAYTLVGLAGTHSLYAFKYGYRAQTADVTLTAGEVLTADFKLQSR